MAGARHRLEELALVRAVRRSLALRMAATTLATGMAIILVLLLLVTSQIRTDVFADRLDTVLEDANLRTITAQAQLDYTTVATADEVAFAAQTQISQIKDSSSGAGGLGVVLARSSEEVSPTVINDLTTSSALRSLVTHELATEVETGGPGHQYWQSAAVPTDGGGLAPGVVVGTQITLPMAGVHDLYLVYTLEPEQRILDLTARSVAVGFLALVIMLILLVWVLTWRVLLPVRLTSLAVQRMASGLLTERLTVRGEDELALLATSFNNMADSIEAQIHRLGELSRLQRRFVSDVSHELRTPLTTIRLAGEQLFEAREDFDDPVLKRSAELLSEQIERFDRMLSDLLEISRFDSGAAALSRKEQDVTAVIDGVVTMTAPLASEKGSEIRLHLPDEPVVAVIDARRVERIVRNLMVNALEHGEGRPVDVTVAMDASAVAVRVRDHGIGMTAKVAENVFDRFYRADPARARTTGGTGLGLSIAQEDAALHNGTLTAWGWPRDGAAFLLVLPRAKGGTPGPGPLPVMPDDAPPLARFVAVAGRMPTQDEDVMAPVASPIGIPVPGPATRWADETGSFPTVADTADAAAEDDEDETAGDGATRVETPRTEAAAHERARTGAGRAGAGDPVVAGPQIGGPAPVGTADAVGRRDEGNGPWSGPADRSQA